MFLPRFATPPGLEKAEAPWRIPHSRSALGQDQVHGAMEIFAHASKFAGTIPTTNPRAS